MTPEVRVADDPAESSRLASLCAMAVRTLPIDGASIVLVSTAGHRTLLAGTGTRAEQLEAVLARCGEGPSVDAVTQGRPVLAGDLAGTEAGGQWPIFTGEALALGVVAVFAAPLRIGVISLGVFAAHRETSGGLSTEDLARLLRVSDAAAFAILDLTIEPAGPTAPGDPSRYQGQIDDPDGGLAGAEIHQASGMVMVQLGVPIEAALARIRAHAYVQEQSLIEVAREVIARTLEFER